MKMLLVGAGCVGESILKILKYRDPKGEWLEKVIVSDYDLERAREVVEHLGDNGRFIPVKVNAKYLDDIVDLIEQYGCDFVMDAASPYVSNNIFDAAYAGGAHYANMGTWSVPYEKPHYGYGLENSFREAMGEHNFNQHEKWRDKKLLGLICLGIDPGVVDVFAKFAAEHLFDELHEVHVKDGGNLMFPSAGENDVVFGFNVWTVLDECLNPNVEWDKEKGFFVEPPFAGKEVFDMPAGVGPNTLIKVEHEETVIMPRYLAKYGLRKCSFKMALDNNLINALKVIDAIGLRSLREIEVDGKTVRPRDVVAAAAPQPKNIGHEMVGKACVGVHCIGIKSGMKREIFMYQPFDNEESIEKWGMQAVAVQTGFGAALAIELIAKRVWFDYGVYGPEYFDPIPYLELMDEAGFAYGMVEMDSEYKSAQDKKEMANIFRKAKSKRKIHTKAEDCTA